MRAEAGVDPPQSHNAVILVVEQDQHVRELQAFFLEKAGFAVQFAADGTEAFELVESLEPDIVITEILVPGVDGLSLCRQIKDAMSQVKVLVFSILSTEGRAHEAGADAFLRKPLEEKRLVETVRELLSIEREAVT